MEICAVCLEQTKKSSPKCSQCSKKVCALYVSKLVKVCASGCGCYNWTCPSCRAVTTGLVCLVNNTVILKELLKASQSKIKDLRELHDLE